MHLGAWLSSLPIAFLCQMIFALSCVGFLVLSFPQQLFPPWLSPRICLVYLRPRDIPGVPLHASLWFLAVPASPRSQLPVSPMMSVLVFLLLSARQQIGLLPNGFYSCFCLLLPITAAIAVG